MKNIIISAIAALAVIALTGCSSTHVQRDYHSRGQAGTHDDGTKMDSCSTLGFVSERQQMSVATTNSLGESTVDGTLTTHKSFNPLNIVAGLIHVDVSVCTSSGPFVRPMYGQPPCTTMMDRYGYYR